MSHPQQSNQLLKEAIVVSATRRFLDIRLTDGTIVQAKAESKAKDGAVGDRVYFTKIGSEHIVSKILPRKNCLERCYRKISKRLSTNSDLLIVMAAAHPLFNCTFIDRIGVAASAQNIPYIILVNKSDLGLEIINDEIEIYKRLKIPVLTASVKNAAGLEEIKSILENPRNSIVTLAGISGVGKSSLLNSLIPSAGRRTSVVSARSGQGKQTTSQSYAYAYQRSNLPDLLLIDLPGLSSYGLSHLSPEQVRENFPEFQAVRENCQYKDCFHINEPDCAVKLGLKDGTISPSRYRSYQEILQELEEAREY